MIINKSGNPVEFLSPGKADIRSLKVYFSPKQLGEGTPAPDNVRDIVGWDEVDVYNNRFLPKEYQEVEYLNSNTFNANQPYINTQIIPNKNMRVKVSGITGNNVNAAGFIFGSRNGAGGDMFWALTWYNNYYIGLGNKRNDPVVKAKGNENFSIDFNSDENHSITINEILYQKATVSETQTYTYPMFLFAINSTGTVDSQKTPVRIKSFTVYENYNDIAPILNFIPCYRKSDSKPGMWDTVSRTFFTNSGTGEFLVGPDVESNGEVVTCEFPQTFYGGYVDLVSGELVETQKRVEYDGSSDENWQMSGSYFVTIASGMVNTRTPPMCDQYVCVNPYNTTFNVRFLAPFSDVRDLRMVLADAPIEVCYELATPITHQLTPQSLQTLINQNTFWTNADRIEIKYDLIESAEMMDIRRRILFNNNPHLGIGTLKYWWSGEDGPNSNNKWVDRVSGIKPDVYGTNVWDSENKCYDFSTQSKYALFDMNVANFNLGNHWRIVFDMDLSLSGNNSAFLDFGSVGNVSKAIGLSLFTTYDFSINWKMQGNNSNPGARITNTGLRPDDTDYHNYKGYYEIVDGGDGYDRFQVFINGVKYVCDVQIPKAQYGPKWNNERCYFGRGYTSGYNGNVKFYDLKIYQID